MATAIPMAAPPKFFSIATLNCRGIKTPEKVSAVYQAIKDLDVVCLQETHFKNAQDADLFERTICPNFKYYNSFTNANSFTGITFVFKRSSPSTSITQLFEIPGRAIGMTLAIGNFSLFLVGLYGPSNDQNGEKERFYNDLLLKVNECPWYNFDGCVILGDFNMVEEPLLDRSANTITRDRQLGLQEFLSLKDLMSIHDVYRVKHPLKNDLFTFFHMTHNTMSRIDRIYSSLNLALDGLCTMRTVNLCDHKLFRTKFNIMTASCKRGNGYYKINTLLLTEYGVDNFAHLHLQHILQNLHYVFQLWEDFKNELKHFFQRLGKEKSKQRNLSRKSLESTIRTLEKLITETNDRVLQNDLKIFLKRKKHELDALNQYYLANCRHNTYYKDYVNDKITITTAKAIQRKDWEQRHIYSIQKTDGTITNDPDDIVKVIHEQYSELFKSEGICQQTLMDFLNQRDFPKLNIEQRNSLENKITPKEVKEAIHALQGNKTPGYDSIPIEFYWKFSDEISVILSHLFDRFSTTQQMHDTAYTGMISLLYKGKGERTKRENWRPLTLLNVDYKIFAKVLSRRLERVITTLIHPDQSSSVPGRTIRDSLSHVMCVTQYANFRNADAMILSVDHQAAFDMVEWDFVFKTLEAMNIGKYFLSLLKSIYSKGNVSSAVIVNGFISDFFAIDRGLRQGCPVSALVYNITAEVVAHYVRKTNTLHGIPLCGTNTRLTKYADDTSFFLTKWEEIDNVFKIFDSYKNASGSRLKPAKTQLLLLGTLRHADVPQRFQTFLTDKLKLYGFLITPEGLNDPENWEKCDETLTKLERRLPPYGVSLFGKIHFIHIYYLCMFNYFNGMITPPAPLIKKAYKAVTKFIWFPSSAHVIKRDVLKLAPIDGGIGFPDFDIRIKVNRLVFFVKVLSSKEELSWRRCFFHFYSRVERLTKRQLNRIFDVPEFYKEIRRAVIDSEFRHQRDFGWFFGEKIALLAFSPKRLYMKWVKRDFSHEMIERNLFWSQHLRVSEAFVKISWQWAKANFTDGRARNIHFRIRHKSLYTNHRLSKFDSKNTSQYCTFCLTNYGNAVREDNVHLLVFCPRAYEFYTIIEPKLCEIAQRRYIELEDLILGRRIHDKSRQTSFNFLIQHTQLAIWQARRNGENNRNEQNVNEIFRKNVFGNLCRVKTITSTNNFFDVFGLIVIKNSSVIGFRLNL